MTNASDITSSWFKKGVEAALISPTAIISSPLCQMQSAPLILLFYYSSSSGIIPSNKKDNSSFLAGLPLKCLSIIKVLKGAIL